MATAPKRNSVPRYNSYPYSVYASTSIRSPVFSSTTIFSSKIVILSTRLLVMAAVGISGYLPGVYRNPDCPTDAAHHPGCASRFVWFPYQSPVRGGSPLHRQPLQRAPESGFSGQRSSHQKISPFPCIQTGVWCFSHQLYGLPAA